MVPLHLLGFDGKYCHLMAILRGFPPSNQIHPITWLPLLVPKEENPDLVYCNNYWATRRKKRSYLRRSMAKAHSLAEVEITPESEWACMKVGWKCNQYFKWDETLYNDDLVLVFMLDLFDTNESYQQVKRLLINLFHYSWVWENGDFRCPIPWIKDIAKRQGVYNLGVVGKIGSVIILEPLFTEMQRGQGSQTSGGLSNTQEGRSELS